MPGQASSQTFHFKLQGDLFYRVIMYNHPEEDILITPVCEGELQVSVIRRAIINVQNYHLWLQLPQPLSSLPNYDLFW